MSILVMRKNFVCMCFLHITMVSAVIPDMIKRDDVIENQDMRCLVQDVSGENLGADISFGIVDLKYDGKTIKICELGESPRSKFKGYDSLYGYASLWNGFWKYVSSLGITPGFVVPGGLDNDYKSRFSYCDMTGFVSCGGVFFANMEDLSTAKPLAKILTRDEKDFDRTSISSYSLMPIIKNNAYRSERFAKIKKNNQDFLFLNEALAPYANSKALMHDLFLDKRLVDYRPDAVMLPCRYYDGMAEDILKRIKSKFLVIKPVNSTKGIGILIIERVRLERMLRILFKKSEEIAKAHVNGSSQSTSYYWENHKNGLFLVEAYAPSKHIVVDNIEYDPTMRVVYILSCDEEKIYLNFQGAYWKLPAKGVAESSSLNDCHKSSIESTRVSSAAVSDEDYKKVTDILRKILPIAYVKMIKNRDNFNKQLGSFFASPLTMK